MEIVKTLDALLLEQKAKYALNAISNESTLHAMENMKF